LQCNVRQDVDIAARYGGEEFVVIMPGADPDTAQSVAERVRRAVIALGIPHVQSELGFVSVSVGLAASVQAGAVTAEDLVRLADGALYDAKRNGRNCVCGTGINTFSLCDV
jgi:diguanylate cyclase (GGDEF)-like protein